jgi:type I restriction enzyme S subunit
LGIIIDIPPKCEQTKIAEILSTVDRAIEQTEALIAKQERIKTGLMQDLLTRGIDEHGNLRSETTHAFKDSPLGRIPVEWEVKPISAIGDVVTGNTPSESAFSGDSRGTPFVTPGDISNQLFVSETVRSITMASTGGTRLIPSNAISVVCIGSTIGKLAMIFSKSLTNQQINSVVCRCEALSFFAYFSMSLFLPAQLRREAGLQAVPIVKKSTFEQLLIAVPGLPDEALEIQKRLLAASTKLIVADRTLSKLRALKTALMQDLLTGRKRVTGLL